MITPISSINSNKINPSFKNESCKWYDNEKLYFIGDKKKRIKKYTLSGVIMAIILPIVYNIELEGKSKCMSMEKFNRKFAFYAAAFVLPIVTVFLMQERANYRHNKKTSKTDTFAKEPKGV